MAAFIGWFLLLEVAVALCGRLVVLIFGRGPALAAAIAVVVLGVALGLNPAGLIAIAFVLSALIRITGGEPL